MIPDRSFAQAKLVGSGLLGIAHIDQFLGFLLPLTSKLVALTPVVFPVKKPPRPFLPERFGVTLNILHMNAQGLADFRTTAHLVLYQVGQDITVTVPIILAMTKNRRTVVQVINKIIMGIKTDRRINHPGMFRENRKL